MLNQLAPCPSTQNSTRSKDLFLIGILQGLDCVPLQFSAAKVSDSSMPVKSAIGKGRRRGGAVRKVGYIRVSTVDQNTGRQLDGADLDKTFTDKASGKDTKRPQLQAGLEYLRDGDGPYRSIQWTASPATWTIFVGS